MDHLSPSYELTKCGCVYVNPDDCSIIIINCLFCNETHDEWSMYINHLQGHLQKQQQDLAKWEINKDCLKEEEEEEIVHNESEDFIENQHPQPVSNDDNWEDLLAIEVLDNLTNDSIKEDLEDGNSDESINDDELVEEHLMDSMEANQDLEKDQPIEAETENDVRVNQPSSLNPTFFRIKTTDTLEMLKFIEILRKYPQQWQEIHPDINNKEKRLASCLAMTKELKEQFNLNISPQATRSSVVYLVRWFEQEYVRLMRCKAKDLQFISLRKDYFEKLLEFLPHKNLKPMTCEECLKHFKYEHLLMAHKHRYHNGKVPFQCRFCGRGFIHHSSHKLHENRHIKVRMWPCKMCLYQAPTKADYIKHLATHSPKQPYKCDICGLSYKTSSNLNVHKKSHGLPQYECELCHKKFYEKYRYKRHIWLHDREEDQSWPAIDNFTCHICGRRFTSNTTLMKHKLVHIQENYDLDTNKGSQRQRPNKDGIIVYYCDYCSLEFINKQAFNTHMNLKHNKE